MALLFTGRHLRSLDGKNRIMVPSEIRDVLVPEDRDGMYLIPSEKCVFVWPRSYLDRYTELKSADPFADAGFNRNFYSQVIFKQFDKTGRIVLPGDIAERYASREVLIVGSGRYLELWVPEEFQATPLTLG